MNKTQIESFCVMCGVYAVVDTPEDRDKFEKTHAKCLKEFMALSEEEQEKKLALARPAHTLRTQ